MWFVREISGKLRTEEFLAFRPLAGSFAAIDNLEHTGNLFIKTSSCFNRKFISLPEHKVSLPLAHGRNFFFIAQEPTDPKTVLQTGSLLHDSCKCLNT